MSNVKEIFAEKKFPTFIKGHSIFKSFKEIKKVFPEIGLPNTEKEIEIDNSKEVKASASALLLELNRLINHRLAGIEKYALKKSDMSVKRKAKLDEIKALLLEIKKITSAKNKTKCITSNNGRLTLNLPTDVLGSDKKSIFKAGEGIFRVYNKLNEKLRGGHFLAMEKIDNIYSFKDFSSKNVPSLKYKIRFSSDGAEGAWDIATMSMRGIQSCQSWDTGGHSSHVVGSVADPFTGILYLTSGAKFNDYGSKMIRRCIVRFVVNERTQTPAILLERMYPSMEKSALDSFKTFLKEKTDNKFEVLYSDGAARNNYYVPMSKIISKLPTHQQPYRDSGMAYKIDISDPTERLKENARGKISLLCNSFSSKIMSGIRSTKLASVDKSSRAALRYLKDYNYPYNNFIIFAEKMFSKTKVEGHEDENSFVKDCIINALNENMFDNISEILGSFLKRYKLKITDDALKTIVSSANEKVVTHFTKEADKIKVNKIKPSDKLSKKVSDIIPIYTKLIK